MNRTAPTAPTAPQKRMLQTPLAPANPHAPHTRSADTVAHLTLRGSCVVALCFSSTSRTLRSSSSSPCARNLSLRLCRALPAVLRPSKHASSSPSCPPLGAPGSSLGGERAIG